MIKLIASDIDGTLVPDGTMKIDPAMIEVVKRCLRNGIRFVGASGRQFLSIARLFQPVSDQIYYIGDSGGILRDAKKIYSMSTLDPVLVREMVQDAKKLDDCDIMLSGRDCDYCEEESEMFYWMRDSYRFNIRVVGDFRNLSEEEFAKMSIYHKDNCEEIVSEWFLPKWGKKFRIMSAGTMWMDIVNPDADKGARLRELQQILGITPAETMAFGDNVNDLGMLAAAEESYAIGSAREEVKKAARHIAPPLSEYGVTTVIQQYLDSIGAE